MRKYFIPAVTLIALVALTISGCAGKPKTDEERNALQPDDTFIEAKITGKTSDYSMRLPDYLTEGYDLNNEASLQYQNIYKEVYVIVIDESKSEYVEMYRDILKDYNDDKSPVENYAEDQMAAIEENMESVTSKSPPRKYKINGNDAIVYDVSGTQSDIADAMGFTVAFIEGDETLYMCMTWTFEKDKHKYQDDMDMMINSFRE